MERTRRLLMVFVLSLCSFAFQNVPNGYTEESTPAIEAELKAVERKIKEGKQKKLFISGLDGGRSRLPDRLFGRPGMFLIRTLREGSIWHSFSKSPHRPAKHSSLTGHLGL